MKVDELLDRMEYLIQNARHVPLSTQIMLNEDEMMELIDQIRFNLPDEIKQANWTVAEQQRIVTEAHAEAARIMSRANERAEETASEHEILRRAERHSSQVVKDAQAKGEQIVRESEAYALEQLKQLEAHLGRTLATVRRGVEALQANQPAEQETADQTVGS
jgi:vacuolar-type H+-ATPase subunit H